MKYKYTVFSTCASKVSGRINILPYREVRRSLPERDAATRDMFGKPLH